MPIPWGVALAADVGGKALSSYADSKQSNADRIAQREQERQRLAEQQRQFNTNLAEEQRQYGGNHAQKQYDQNTSTQMGYGDRAMSANRELELLPMRDKAAALMMQRMGTPAQQTSPRSLAGGGTDALRGGAAPQMPYDLNANAASAAAYKAGDGGMTGNVQRELLQRYMDVPKSPDMPAFTPQAAGPQAQKESDKIRETMVAFQQQGAPREVLQNIQRALDAALAREAGR